MWVKEVSRTFYPSKENLARRGRLRRRGHRADRGGRRVHPAGRTGPDRAGVHARQHADVHVRSAGRAQRPRRGDRVRRLPDQSGREPITNGSTRHRPIIGLHVCRGNWSQDETTLLRGSYHPLTSYFAQMQVDQLVLEYATRARAISYRSTANRSVSGSLTPRSTDRVGAGGRQSRDHGASARPAGQAVSEPDCGFATFTTRAMSSADVAAGRSPRWQKPRRYFGLGTRDSGSGLLA